MNYTDELLVGICGKLQLQPNKYELASERYQTIANTIQEDDVFKRINLNMYPQGSFRLKTTVKPLNGDDYDLDFVVELPYDEEMTPRDLYDNIFRILAHDGTHNDMVEKKSRCIRVNYANDFHMDIMPGQRISNIGTEIEVPDKELKRWYHHSNPIAFADWFENQAKKQIRMIFEASKALNEQAEPVEDQEIFTRLEPLRRAVQLVKRYRDVYCDSHSDEDHTVEPVRSIIICTLMGYITSSYGSEIQIIQDFCTYVNKKIALSDGRPFVVKNPVVDEVLTEKWQEGNNYQDFVDMMGELTTDVKKLSTARINTDIDSLLKKMFGETVTNTVILERAQRINEDRKSGNLGINQKGNLGTTNVVANVKKNTFYGE